MDLLNSIMDQMEDAFILSDKKGEILLFNKTAIIHSQSFLEKPLQKGQNLAELGSPARKGIVRSLLEEVQQTKLPQKSFAEYLDKYGITSFLEFRYAPVLDETGLLAYIYTFIKDITPQKVFEKKLTILATNTGQLIEKANAIIIGVDTRGYVTDWNEHCAKLTGLGKNEVYAQRFSEILLPLEEKERFESMMTEVLNNYEISNIEISVLTKTGQRIILLLNSSIRYAPSGMIIGVLLIGQDVTELTEYRQVLEKRVEERTRELKKALEKEKELVEMKSRFVSIASHEFRTPLSSIQYTASFIKKNNARLAPEEVQDKLANIEKQIRHMTHLLDDVLTYSKNEAGKILLITSNILLKDFIQKIIHDVGHTTKNTHTVKLEVADLPSVITTDEKLLRSILINLLTNAIKFSPGKKCVTLTAKSQAGKLIFTIHDQGIGIPEEEKTKIFEPFLRGKGADSIQGTGLGLSIVKKSVELLKGTIDLESRPGEGTMFTVIVPERAGP